MGKDKGFSREGLFGTIHHYDSKGHKIGESRPGLFGGYTDYDSKGHKIGTSREKLLGGGFDHFDNRGRKIGSSEERLLGGYTTKDAAGRVTGTTGRSVFDMKTPDEIAATGSLYGSTLYPHGAAVSAAAEIASESDEKEIPSETEMEDAFIKGDFISADDMALLRDAGYNELDLELMDGAEFRDALDQAGVDPFFYNFDD